MSQILQKGANASLAKIAPKIDTIQVTLNWTFADNSLSQWDIDATAFLLNSEGTVRGDKDIVFYNQSSTANGAIELQERTAENSQRFTIQLNKIPKPIQKIAFSLTLYEPEKNNTNFGQLQTIKATIGNTDNTVEYASYELEERSQETALIIIELYRHQDEWKVKAINQPTFRTPVTRN